MKLIAAPLLCAIVLLLGCARLQAAKGTASIYRGMCDASAGVALDTRFFAVASDEDSVIRTYDSDAPGLPVKTTDLAGFLKLEGTKPETDMEGAARVGDTIYWISSHGRNKEGRERANRHRFFATQIKPAGGAPEIVPFGHPYDRLLNDLVHASFAKTYGLVDAAARAPKAIGGLNIEGLTAGPNGTLLIGVRNPIPRGKALLIPLLNPGAILTSKARAKFGTPIELDLRGFGIRDIAQFGNEYILVAGAYDSHQGSMLYRWRGGSSTPEPLELSFKHFNPEAIVSFPDKGEREFQVLSDDGARQKQGIECKRLPENERTFRAEWIGIKDH